MARKYAVEHAARIYEQINPEDYKGVTFKELARTFGIGQHPARELRILINGPGMPSKKVSPPVVGGMTIPDDDEADTIPLADLVQRRIEDSRRAIARGKKARKPVRIEMPAGPLGVITFGDPHLDDDGCDWDQLLADVKVAHSSPHIYSINIGDTVNNWVGRLVKLWAHQGTTEDDAWRLARWFMGEPNWLAWIHGNHDMWNDGGRILDLLLENASVAYKAPSEARIEMVWPSGKVQRIHARHDFKGHSQYNPNHGLKKAALWDGWADMYVAGHRHTWAGTIDEYDDGRCRWLVRARGYKRADHYAMEKGFHEQAHGCAVMTIHDPDAPHPAERIRVFLDLAHGAEYLAWLRASRGLD